MNIGTQFRFGWSPRPKIHFAIALIVCMVSGIIALLLYENANADLAASSIVKGVVVDSEIRADGMHTPVVEYEFPGGNRSRFLANFSSRPQKYYIGDIVEVVISNETAKPKLKNFFTIYGPSSFAALFSLISLIGATGIYFFRVRKLT